MMPTMIRTMKMSKMRDMAPIMKATVRSIQRNRHPARAYCGINLKTASATRLRSAALHKCALQLGHS